MCSPFCIFKVYRIGTSPGMPVFFPASAIGVGRLSVPANFKNTFSTTLLETGPPSSAVKTSNLLAFAAIFIFCDFRTSVPTFR